MSVTGKYELPVAFLLYLYMQFLGVFFMDPNFPDRIRFFGRSGSGQKDPDPKHWYFTYC